MTGKKFYLIFFVAVPVILMGFTALLAHAGICTQDYCDSDVLSATTTYNYGFYCGTPATTSVTVGWSINDPSVTYININDSLLHANYTRPVSPPWPGSYTINNLSPGMTYYYSATLGYGPRNSPGTPGTPTPGTIACPTAGAATSSPTDAPNLYTFSLGTSSLVLNWQDMVTSDRQYHFELQRMRATPLKPIQSAVNLTSFGISSTSVGINVGWKNVDTVLPAFAQIVRTSAQVGQFAPGDLSVATTTSATSSPNTSVTSTITGLKELTTYYFKINSCFGDANAIPSDVYTKNYLSSHPDVSFANSTLFDVNPESVSSRPCSDFYPATSSFPSVLTTPYAPSNLTITDAGAHYVTLAWTNNSSGATGFTIVKDGSTLVYSLPVNQTSYTDSGLSPNTSADYQVYAYYQNGSLRLYSASSNTTTGNTLNGGTIVIQTTINGVATSSVGGCKVNMSGPGVYNQSYSCSSSLASQEIGDYYFQWNGVYPPGTNTTTPPTTTVSPPSNYLSNNGTLTYTLAFKPAPTGPYGMYENPNSPLMADISSVVSGLFDGIGNAFQKAVSNVNGLFYAMGHLIDRGVAYLSNIFIAEGQTTGNSMYNNYFQTVQTIPSTTYYYRDNGLISGTVYIYRIRVVYDSGTGATSSNWSYPAAARTFSSSADCPSCTTGGGGICVAYGVCKAGLSGTPPQGSTQCGTGGDCTSIGKSASPIFKEK